MADYPDLDDLIREFPAGEAVVRVAAALTPWLWRLFRPLVDESGRPIGGVRVRGIAYAVAQDVTIEQMGKQSMIAPDVAALAGVPGAPPPGAPPAAASPEGGAA